MNQEAVQELTAKLAEIVEPVVRSEGLILVELIWRRESHGWVLRLYVDRPEGGVTLDECALVSRQISDLLDVEDLIEPAYHLEVSSPGLNRKIGSPREYELFAGRPIRITWAEPVGKTQTLRGKLMGLKGEDVLVEVKGKIKPVPLAQVAKARLEAPW